MTRSPSSSSASRTRAFVGLGSNVGDRLGHLRRAVAELSGSPEIEITSTSSVYETDPVGPPQPDFLNAVVEISTTLDARALLARLKSIETDLGREPGARWGPRTIDLDLLLYGEVVIENDDLRVPHPQMTERAFVLVPLVEIAPATTIPGFGRAEDLRDAVGAEGVRRFEPPEALAPT